MFAAPAGILVEMVFAILRGGSLGMEFTAGRAAMAGAGAIAGKAMAGAGTMAGKDMAGAGVTAGRATRA